MFDPAMAGAGTHTITYTFNDGSGCPGVASQTVIVELDNCLTQPTCQTFTPATGLPMTIEATSQNNTFDTITFDVTSQMTLTDVNVLNITGTHTSTTDLHMYLVSPSGTFKRIFAQSCGSNQFNMTIDDAYPNVSGWSDCGTPGGATEFGKSNDINTSMPTLGDFNGEKSQGTWLLIVEDLFAGDGGTITGVSLELCGSTTPISFTPPASLCSTAAPISLTATPTGGIFIGTGVTGNMFCLLYTSPSPRDS